MKQKNRFFFICIMDNRRDWSLLLSMFAFENFKKEKVHFRVQKKIKKTRFYINILVISDSPNPTDIHGVL